MLGTYSSWKQHRWYGHAQDKQLQINDNYN